MRSYKIFFGLLLFVCKLALPCHAEDGSLDQGLLAYLPLKQDLLNHSVAKLKIKRHGTVELRDGAAYFDGKESWLDIPHIDLSGRPFAVSMWIKITGSKPMYGLVAQRGDNTPNQWLHLMLRGGRQPYLGFLVNDAISPRDIALNTWAHLVFQYNDGNQEIWVDGQLLCARKSIAYEGKKGPTAIGKSPNWNNVPSKNFEGYIRDVRFYGRALAPNEILTLNQLENYSLPGMNPANKNKKILLTANKPDEALSNALAAQVGIPFLSIEGRKLVITGEAGQIYEVQASSDLFQPWQPLVSLTNVTGVVEYTDMAAPDVAQRFYRIKVQ
ncbi:LamG domain-containing protein [Pedosphaera parvula]|uniref:LamG domain protein jellyroll fold domain protein n=1 Tax=Pedosphaera parvula (strain Ellin514) TaxID=320771 RepID=B9XSS4_PEDPL|nr:LamG domain-containing protein [Pedosphaera parvula]EEF57126.1 hypothetical protein Cflav_PD0166 [Pedosphaera parvula Ellin514]